jgi:hypothetical protein
MLVRRIRLASLRLTLALSLAVVASAALGLSAHAQRAANPITITAQSQSIHFPNYIDYQLSVTDTTTKIVGATIHLTLDTTGDQESQSMSFTPAQTLTLHWREDTSGDNFLIPGTPIAYYWEITDELANVNNSTVVHFTTADTRFTWQSLSQGLMHIHWYNQPGSFGQAILNKALIDRQHIVQTIGADYRRSFDLWVYGNETDFRSALPPGTVEWVGGEAFPRLNEAFFMVQSTTDETLVRDMPHEMTHLLFHQITANGLDAPTWFDEGLAVYCQLYHEPEMTDRLNEALQTHSLLPLNEISLQFPRNSDQAYLAYAESWNLVDYMYRTFGQARMLRLIELLNSAQQDFDQDLLTALGEDQNHLENQWHLYLHQPPTLSGTQLTPTVQPRQPQPKPVLPATSDRSTFALTTLGGLLTLAGLIGLVLVVTSIRRQRAQAQAAVEAAVLFLASQRASQQPPAWPAAAPPPAPFSGSPPSPAGPHLYLWPEEGFGSPPDQQERPDNGEPPPQPPRPPYRPQPQE